MALRTDYFTPIRHTQVPLRPAALRETRLNLYLSSILQGLLMVGFSLGLVRYSGVIFLRR